MSKFSEFLQKLANQHAGTVAVPRWVVYFQAILLGVVSITCFLFGLAAANLSRTQTAQPRSVMPCEITGHVLDDSVDESGAIIVLLPIGKLPAERLDPSSLHPNSYKVLDNPVIAALTEIGGAVTRTNQNGRFWITVDSPQSFLLVVISQQAARGPSTLNREETAALANYFLPIEALYSGQKVFTKSIHARGERLDVGQIQFD